MDEATQSEGGWRSSGWVAFAGIFLGVTGAFDLIYGLGLLLRDNWAAIAADRIIVFDVSAWGWLLIVTGGLKVAVGLGLLRGLGWARAAAIVLLIANMLEHWAFAAANPANSLLAIGLNALILYALVVPEHDATRYEGYWDVKQAQRPPPTQIPR